jgi:hypothetical protein
LENSNSSDEINSHIRHLKNLIIGPKRSRNKNPLVVTPGTWATHEDTQTYIVGIPTDDGKYHITWKNKDGSEISKEQMFINFSYLCSLNPTIILKLIAEYERLKTIETNQAKSS